MTLDDLSHKFFDRIDRRIQLATHLSLRGIKRVYNTGKGRRADDHHVHVAVRVLLAARERAEYESDANLARERGQRQAKDVPQPRSLDD